jgi:hypothetical protein
MNIYGVGEMVVRTSKIRAISLTLAVLCFVCSPLWLDLGWAQQIRTDQPRTEPRRPPASVAPAAPTDPSSVLGSALVSCDKAAEGSEPLVLPGTKGEIKLDLCYRRRDHLVCSFSALQQEAKSLVENYGKIVEANYPVVSNVDGVCSLKADDLSTDLQRTIDFINRFKALKSEYDARSNCASRITQSLKDVNLPDLARGPDVLKSMIDSFDGDMRSLSSALAKVAELAEKIDSSHKAIVIIRKVHKAMCVSGQSAAAPADDKALSR